MCNCSSVLGLVPMPWRGAYDATKYALEAMSDTLRLELRGTGIDGDPDRTRPDQPPPFASNAKREQFHRWIDWQTSALGRSLYRERLLSSG